MKKLMIAMSAAAICALSAQAESTDLKGTMNFSGYTVEKQGEGAKPFAVAADPGDESGMVYWAGEMGDSEIQNKEDDQGNFLHIDTTNPLYRQTAAADAEAVAPVAIPTAANANITISTDVQFTAADEAPTADDGDKLLVWMAAADATKSPAQIAAVMVTDAEGAKVLKDLSGLSESALKDYTDAWHTLEIKAVAAGEGLAKTAAFKVTLDGVESTATYKSRVTGGDNAQTISSVGFKGTGAVDNIAFTMDAGVAPTYALNISADAGVESYVATVEEVEVTDTIADTATEVIIAVTLAEGKAINEEATCTAGIEWSAADSALVVSVADAVVERAITVSIVTKDAAGPVEPDPIVPGTTDTVTITAESATAAIAAVKITVPAAAAELVEADAYKAYFKITAKEGEKSGTYDVTAELDPDVVTPAIDDKDEDLDIAAGAITVATKAGLYYQLIRGTTVKAIDTTVDEVLGDGTTLTLTDDAKPANAAFYKVGVTAAPTAK